MQKIDNNSLPRIIALLEAEYRHWPRPMISELVVQGKATPFVVLIGTILSLRTRDETTGPALERLLRLADRAETLARVEPAKIAKAIYPVGFYNNKSKTIIEVCEILTRQHDGEVPASLDELLKLPGVGRKTANLVMTLGHGLDGICVDTHVHRISNRFGYVKTSSPDDTEMALRKQLPRQYWIRYNDLLVGFGQQICKPISPLCSRCPTQKFCPKLGVERHR